MTLPLSSKASESKIAALLLFEINALFLNNEHLCCREQCTPVSLAARCEVSGLTALLTQIWATNHLLTASRGGAQNKGGLPHLQLQLCYSNTHAEKYDGMMKMGD